MIRQIKIIWTSCSLEVILLSGQEAGAKTQFVTSIVAQQLIIWMKHAALILIKSTFYPASSYNFCSDGSQSYQV